MENICIVNEELEKIIIEIEVVFLNNERYVEDDDFEVEFKFLEIGYNIDLIVEIILKIEEFDELFEKVLK